MQKSFIFVRKMVRNTETATLLILHQSGMDQKGLMIGDVFFEMRNQDQSCLRAQM